MSVDPTVLAVVGAAVVTVGGALAYSLYTGRSASASVDVDNDGEDEATVEFEGQEEGVDNLEDQNIDMEFRAAPEDVRDIGTDLASIKGLGETKADALRDNGFRNVSDLYFASDEELAEVTGIAETTVERIRSDIGSSEDES